MEKNNPGYKNKEKNHQPYHAHGGTALRNIMRPMAGYGKATVAPSGERQVWLSLQQRISFIPGVMSSADAAHLWLAIYHSQSPHQPADLLVVKASIGPKKESYGLWNQQVK